MGPWMVANWANIGRLLPDVKMATISTLPNHHIIADIDGLRLYPFQKFLISLLMGLLNGSHPFESLRDLMETFFSGSFSEFLVHLSPFVVLPFSGTDQVLRGFSDAI